MNRYPQTGLLIGVVGLADPLDQSPVINRIATIAECLQKRPFSERGISAPLRNRQRTADQIDGQGASGGNIQGKGLGNRDSVIKLMRRADVRIEIDGQPLDLVCAPYVMPTETAGLRIQADTTSGWIGMAKRVQLSLWDACDPIVDTTRFGFPLRNYRLFSQGTQAYNEPVHLGRGDGDPAGQRGL